MLGLGGAGAAGIALAVTRQERPNTPPAAQIILTPDGHVVVGVTTVGFTALASDPEGDPLSYAWDFGDGGQTVGATAAHVFGREGSLSVRLTVSDGLASTTVTASVTAKSVAGRWSSRGPLFAGVTGFEFGVGGENPALMSVHALPGGGGSGLATDPRGVAFSYQSLRCVFSLEGELDLNLQTINGVLRCLEDLAKGASAAASSNRPF